MTNEEKELMKACSLLKNHAVNKRWYEDASNVRELEKKIKEDMNEEWTDALLADIDPDK